jgi:hypothetical protein
MPPFKNISGQRFGKLVAIKYKDNKYKWECKCDCGNIKSVAAGHLNNGSISSCGCHTRLVDITGEKFGRLRVIGFSCMRNNNSYWKCKCKCGNVIEASKSNLKAGNIKSCGCYSQRFQEQTNMKKYGTKSSFQNKKVRQKFEQNNIKKYGVPYPAQDYEISLKTARSQKNSYILRHWKTKEKLICTASWEKKVVEYLNNNNIEFGWKTRSFDVLIDGKKRKYFPDLYLSGINKWVEIKGYKRDLGMKKWNYFHKYVKKNSELWDKSKLIKMGIL